MKRYSQLIMLLTTFLSFTASPIATAHDHNHKTEIEVINEVHEAQLVVEEQIEELSQTEKLYSLSEILSLPPEAFPNATEEEVNRIKEEIKLLLSETPKELIENFRKIPLSLVYVDKTTEQTEAVLSGGGLPYCLDDNGWGPFNFITSDCDRAMLVVHECIYESIIKKPEWRYCRADLNRNCSPRIGHSPHWHTH